MSIRGELQQQTENELKVLPLETPRFTIGRGPENSLCLPHGVVSRAHAEVIRLGNDFLLRDLGSTNGSFVNGTRISEQMLNDCDTLRFGHGGPELSFKLYEAGAVTAPTYVHPPSTTRNLIQSLSGRMQSLPTDVCEEVNVRCVLAEAHLNQGQNDRAYEVLAKYGESAPLTPLPAPFRARALLWLGRAQIERKQDLQAVDALQRSLACYTQAGDEAGGAEAHASLGRALAGKGELFAARDHLHRAMLAARRAGNARLRAEVHYQVGKLDWRDGDFEGARFNWTRAGLLAEGSSDALLQARVKMQQAFVLYAEANLKDAVPEYQSAINQLEALGHVRLLLKAYSGLSRVLVRLGSWGAALRLLDDRLRLAREHQLAKAEAVALTDLAELKLFQGDLMAAWNAIQNAVARHGATVYGRTQRIFGRALLSRGQPAEAIDVLEKGLVAARDKGALEEQVLLSLELALVQLDKGDMEKARAHLESAEAATALDPALGLTGRVLYTRGCIQAATFQTAEANRSFTQSLSLFQNIGDMFRGAQAEAAIGVLRLNVGRLESARAHLDRAQNIFAKLGATGELRRVEARLASSVLAGVAGAMTMTSPALSRTAHLSMSRPVATVGATMVLPNAQQVLLAIGNGELATQLARGLEAENYVVAQLQDGRAALEHALGRERNYNMLVLDALLEHHSGFDICRELRKRKQDTPVILLGGRFGLEDKIEALQAGADDFLSKRNLVFEELLAKMEALLR